MEPDTLALAAVAGITNYVVVGYGGVAGLAPDVTAAVAAAGGRLLVALAAADEL